MESQLVLSPVEFERVVKEILEAADRGLTEFAVTHREKIIAGDGTYEIDVAARFTALGVSFLVLVECKHQSRPVERETVQILSDRLRSMGAQKGILFSTSGFQRGAVAYAQAHGIALIQVADGRTAVLAKAKGLGLPARDFGYVGWLLKDEDDAGCTECLVDSDGAEELAHFMSGKGAGPVA